MEPARVAALRATKALFDDGHGFDKPCPPTAERVNKHKDNTPGVLYDSGLYRPGHGAPVRVSGGRHGVGAALLVFFPNCFAPPVLEPYGSIRRQFDSSTARGARRARMDLLLAWHGL